MTTATLPIANPMLPTSVATHTPTCHPHRHCYPQPLAAAAPPLSPSSSHRPLSSPLSSPPSPHSPSTDFALGMTPLPLPLSSPTSPPPPPDGSTTRNSSPDSPSLDDDSTAPLSLYHIIFGIASFTQFWPRHRGFLRLWWHLQDMSGHVSLDDHIPRP